MSDCAFYVEDSLGDKFLYTVADASYEPKFREHAKWWRNYMRTHRLRRDGKPIRQPVSPTKVVVEALRP